MSDQNQKGGKPQDVKQITNDNLLAKWHSFTVDQNDENMSNFLEELIEHTTLLMVVLSPEELSIRADGTLDFDNIEHLQFPLMTTQEGENIQPLFSDWQAVNTLFESWDENQLHTNVEQARVLPITFIDAAGMVRDNTDVAGMAINPFSDNITLDRDSIVDLLRQAEEHRSNAAEATDEVAIAVSDVEEIPDGVWEAVEKELRKHAEIKRAWLRSVHYDGEATLLLVLDMPKTKDDQRAELAKLLATVGQAEMPEGEQTFSAALLDDDSTDIIKDVKPNYTAK